MILISGKHATLAVLKNKNRVIDEVYCTDKNLNTINSLVNKRGLGNKLKVVTKEYLDNIVKEDVNHQGFAVKCLPKKICTLHDAIESNAVLILDQVTDSKNVGAIIRSAAAFGVKYIIMQERHSPEENNLMAQASSGGLEYVQIVKVANLTKAIKFLQSNDYWVCALTVNTDQDISSLQKFKGSKIALVAGSEGKGIRRLVEESCDLRAKINIREESQSLNVSSSLAIALYIISCN